MTKYPLSFLFPIIAAAISWLLVFLIRRWAQRNMLDVPNERSSHSNPTPRGGGLAIVLVALCGWLLHVAFDSSPDAMRSLAYVLGGAAIAAVSWIDDVRTLSNRVRFATHGLAAVLVMWAWGYWDVVTLPLVGELSLGWGGAIITFLWITGLTNAYNFMDGIDGIAAGQAIIAGCAWALIAAMLGLPFVIVLAALLGAGSVGFLWHNWPPARIFMGDVGSAFIGFSFATLTLMANRSDSRLALAGVVLLWPFLFDTIFTVLRRLLRGENIFAAHRSHLYQRLVIAGHSHRFVTLLYCALALCGAALSYAWAKQVRGAGEAIILLVPLMGLGLWLMVVRRERWHETPAQF